MGDEPHKDAPAISVLPSRHDMILRHLEIQRELSDEGDGTSENQTCAGLPNRNITDDELEAFRDLVKPAAENDDEGRRAPFVHAVQGILHMSTLSQSEEVRTNFPYHWQVPQDDFCDLRAFALPEG